MVKIVFKLTFLAIVLGASTAQAGTYEGRIDGDFHGWDGSTIYKLQDGHIIQQSSYHYHYHYAFSPEVIIYTSPSGSYKIHVLNDTDEDVSIVILH